MEWFDYPGGLHWIGHEGPGFAFDNEAPRHQVFLRPFCLGSRLVTNGEYLAFMEADGYRRPELWLSAGWDAVQTHGWNAPLYWERHCGGWQVMTLSGLRDLDLHEPVCHVSYFEADAYLRWAEARLPLESEWEVAAAGLNIEGNFADSGRFHPAPMAGEPPTAIPSQIFGDAWEWTASPYSAYPAYRPAAGALGEYNGKFMCNQLVLRGGSCATLCSHIRTTYRNFFPPETRWQFAGIRPAKDIS